MGNVGEFREFRVFVENERIFNAPGNANLRIIPQHAVLAGWVVEVAAFIEELNRVGKSQETVGETGGNENLILFSG